MDGEAQHMERPKMDEKNNTKESPKRQIHTNQQHKLGKPSSWLC